MGAQPGKGEAVGGRGRWPHAARVSRTRPFHYCAFNLEAATRLAQYNRALWREPCLLQGIAYLQVAALSPVSWKYLTPSEPTLEAEKLLPLLPMARHATRSEQCGNVSLPRNRQRWMADLARSAAAPAHHSGESQVQAPFEACRLLCTPTGVVLLSWEANCSI